MFIKYKYCLFVQCKPGIPDANPCLGIEVCSCFFQCKILPPHTFNNFWRKYVYSLLCKLRKFRSEIILSVTDDMWFFLKPCLLRVLWECAKLLPENLPSISVFNCIIVRDCFPFVYKVEFVKNRFSNILASCSDVVTSYVSGGNEWKLTI